MQIVISGTAFKPLFSNVQQAATEIVWINHAAHFAEHRNADVYIDLLFEPAPAHQDLLLVLPAPVVVNSVIETISELHPSFVRLNGWPGLFGGKIIEASFLNSEMKGKVETVFACMEKEVEWVPDVPGFITPRIISTIINEAYFALSEGVSSKDEIDTAMKLGTAYPYGPFEWSEKIGLHNVAALLLKLSRTQKRYQPSPLLLSTAGFSN